MDIRVFFCVNHPSRRFDPGYGVRYVENEYGIESFLVHSIFEL